MHIKYKGIKGRSGDYDLGRACLLQGGNGSGKSALVAAVQLALTKRVASMRLGKGDTQDPGRLLKAMDDGAVVEVHISDSVVRRRLEATAKKARIITTCDGKEGEEAEARASRLAGDIIFADFRRLVAAGDAEKTDILSTYLPQPEDATKKGWIVNQCIAHMIAVLKPLAKKGKANEPECADKWTKDDRAKALAALRSLSDANGVTKYVADILNLLKTPDLTPEALIELIRVKTNEADTERKTAGKLAEEAAKAGAHDQALASEVEALESQVNVLRAAVADADRDLADREAWQKRLDSDQVRKATLEAEIKTSTTAAAQLAQATTALAQAKTKQVEVARNAPVTPDLGATRELEKTVAGKEADLRTAQAEAAKLPTAEQYVKTQNLAVARIVNAKPNKPAEKPSAEEVAVLAERRGQLAGMRIQYASDFARWELVSAGTCPTCGAEFTTSPEELVDALDVAAEAISTLANETAAMEAAHRAATQAWDKYQTDLAAFERQYDAASAEEKRAKQLRDAAKAAADKIGALTAELEPMQREVALLHKAQDDHQALVTAWHASKITADAAVATAQTAVDTATRAGARLVELRRDLANVEASLAALAADPIVNRPTVEAVAGLEDLEARLTAAHAAKARIEVMAGANVDAKTRETNLWKAAHKGADAGLVACIQGATTPIVTKVSAALKRMGIDGDFYVDLEAKTFGVKTATKLVDVEALSGGEQVLFAAAMLSSLPPKGGPRVMTLEGAELSAKWLTRLLGGLDIEAFDCVIVASCHRPDTVSTAWTVIDMGEAEPVGKADTYSPVPAGVDHAALDMAKALGITMEEAQRRTKGGQ